MYNVPNPVTRTSPGIEGIAKTRLIILISEIKVYIMSYSLNQS